MASRFKFQKPPAKSQLSVNSRKSSTSAIINVATFSTTIGSSSSPFTSVAARVPALQAILEVANAIAECCKQMKTHVHIRLHLVRRIENLLDTLSAMKPEVVTKTSENNPLGTFTKILAIINNVAASKSRWYNFAHDKEIVEKFELCDVELTACINMLEVTYQIHVLRWHTTFEKSRLEDHQAMIALLSNIKSIQEANKEIGEENNDVLVEIMETIQMISRADSFPLNSLTRVGLASSLHAFQLRTGEPLPICELIPDEVSKIDRRHPVDFTANAHVYEANYLKSEKVVMKILIDTDARSIKRMKREALNWQEAWKAVKQHHSVQGETKIFQYILPLYGYCVPNKEKLAAEMEELKPKLNNKYVYDESKIYPFLVSPLCRNGSADHWVKNHDPDVDYIQMIRDIAFAIKVLHDANIVHSDIKGANILISDQGAPLLADFGMSRRLASRDINYSRTTNHSGSQRFQAPELTATPETLESGRGAATDLPVDIWAFGMTVLELLTHQPPFSSTHKSTSSIWGDIKRGIRPERPTDETIVNRGLTNDLWDLLNRCWCLKPKERPVMAQIVADLDKMLAAREAKKNDLSLERDTKVPK